MITLQWAAASDTGRVRPVNEDSFWAGDGLFVVADGLGGHAAGEIASATAVDHLRQWAEHAAAGVGLTRVELELAIQSANGDILRDGAHHPEHAGMGTTVAGVVRLGQPDGTGPERWLVFHLGDSRVYRYADEQLQQLTVDHSAVQEMVAAGYLQPADARSHPQRNIVTRSLGQKEVVDPEFSEYEIVTGERLLICSDGLTEELADGDIAEVLRSHTDAAGATEALIAAANDAGGRDNITVIVISVRAGR